MEETEFFGIDHCFDLLAQTLRDSLKTDSQSLENVLLFGKN